MRAPEAGTDFWGIELILLWFAAFQSPPDEHSRIFCINLSSLEIFGLTLRKTNMQIALSSLFLLDSVQNHRAQGHLGQTFAAQD